MPPKFNYRWLVVAGLVLIISLLHYLTPQTEGLRHLIYRELYLLPIFLASFWHGLKGGLLSSFAITVIYLPSVFLSDPQAEVHLMGNVMQVGVFILFALTLGFLRDRDLRYQKEQQRNASLAAMGQAVSSIAHDLKSPLMAVGGFVTQVRRKLDDDDPSAHKLDIAIAQTARMESMVKDMLAFARPLDLKRKEVDLNLLIRQVVEVSEAANDRAGRITTDLDGRLPRLHLDNDRMQQAILNLINNALEASPEDGVVRVSSVIHGEKVEIEVQDEGPGIPTEKQNQLFTPFVSTKKGGTGLGLPIAIKIVEAHGGVLSLMETTTKGTSFLIELPIS